MINFTSFSENYVVLCPKSICTARYVAARDAARADDENIEDAANRVINLITAAPPQQR